MSDRKITVWLDERWYDALTETLKGESLEDKLGDYIDDLCNLLPLSQYEKISAEIFEERQMMKNDFEESPSDAVTPQMKL